MSPLCPAARCISFRLAILNATALMVEVVSRDLLTCCNSNVARRHGGHGNGLLCRQTAVCCLMNCICMRLYPAEAGAEALQHADQNK